MFNGKMIFCLIFAQSKNGLNIMKEYSYERESVEALCNWVAHATFPKEVKLDEAEVIFDVPLFVQANLNDIKGHYPDPFYNPAITRLYRLKEILEG